MTKKGNSTIRTAPADFNKKFKKVAIVHNWIWKMRGAERCLKALSEVFPNADIYFLFGDKTVVEENFPGHKVYFSWLQKLPFIKKLYKATLPFWPVTVEQFDMRGYDLVISSSAAVAHGVITDQHTKHICYLYSPMRYIWDQQRVYFESKGHLFNVLISPVLHFLRIWDVAAAKRPDLIIPISRFVRRRVEKYWKVECAEVIYPPVDMSFALKERKLPTLRESFFLAISPFEENKGAIEMVKAAIQSGFELKIIGDGALRDRCEQLAKASRSTNVEFLGWISEDEKVSLLRRAQGLLSFGVEDFGIVTVEAIALGCPVIARNQGGALEIIEPGSTGFLMNDLTQKSIEDAIRQLQDSSFDELKMKSSVEKFSKERFINQLETTLKSC